MYKQSTVTKMSDTVWLSLQKYKYVNGEEHEEFTTMQSVSSLHLHINEQNTTFS